MSTEDTPKPPAKRQKRKITSGDVEAIATLITRRRLTETEACHSLGINAESWFHWKIKPHNQAEERAAFFACEPRGLNRVASPLKRWAMEHQERAGIGGRKPGCWKERFQRNLLRSRTKSPPPPQPTIPLQIINTWISVARGELDAERVAGGAAAEVVGPPVMKQIANATPTPALPAAIDGPGREVWNTPTAPAPPKTHPKADRLPKMVENQEPQHRATLLRKPRHERNTGYPNISRSATFCAIKSWCRGFGSEIEPVYGVTEVERYTEPGSWSTVWY